MTTSRVLATYFDEPGDCWVCGNELDGVDGFTVLSQGKSAVRATECCSRECADHVVREHEAGAR